MYIIRTEILVLVDLKGKTKEEVLQFIKENINNPKLVQIVEVTQINECIKYGDLGQ